MIARNDLLASVREKLQKAPKLPGEVAELAFEVFLLMLQDPGRTDSDITSVAEGFQSYVRGYGQEEALQNQIRYAIRLATAKGDLLYEEMHKLFSLCDEIEGLRRLGFSVDEKTYTEFIEAARLRFRKEARKARLAAEHNVDEWNRDCWWYAENLRT